MVVLRCAAVFPGAVLGPVETPEQGAPQDVVHQRALAASRGPGDGQEASGLQLERDISEDGDLAPARDVGLGERLTAQDGHESILSPSPLPHHIGKPVPGPRTGPGRRVLE